MRTRFFWYVFSARFAYLICSSAKHVDDTICDEREKPSASPVQTGAVSMLQHRQSLAEVPAPIEHAPFVPADTKTFRKVLWIHAFARSGSSLVLGMIKSSGEDVFTLYEPCHNGDKLTEDLAAQGCLGLLRDLAQCNFSGVEGLWGWSSRHTTNADSPYSKELATNLCAKATLVAFKTIDQVGNMSSIVQEELRVNPWLRIINIVRDPRAIYASREVTPGKFPGRHRIHTLLSICDSFAACSNVSHARFMHLVYEDLVTNATAVARRVQEFLGRLFTVEHQNWIRDNFNTESCASASPYSICSENATASLYKYREILSNNEYAAFMAHRQCRDVSETFGYDPFYFQEEVLEHNFYNLLQRPWFGFGALSCVAGSACVIGAFLFALWESCKQERKSS